MDEFVQNLKNSLNKVVDLMKDNSEDEHRERQDEQFRNSLEKLNDDAGMVDSEEIAKLADSSPSASDKQSDKSMKEQTAKIINAAKSGLSVLQKTQPEQEEPESEVLDDNPFAHQLWN